LEARWAAAFAFAVVLRDAEGVGATVVVRPEPPASPAEAGIVAVVAARGSAADEDGDDPCPQAVRAVTTAAERTRRTPGRRRTRAT
jgi:hypothetical protein